jgi:hypothetical protein
MGDETINKRMNGEIFCQVRINILMDHVEDKIIGGNQKCIGGIPPLISNAVRIRKLDVSKYVGKVLANIMNGKINITEAIACAKKYLIQDSVDSKLILFMMRGISLIRLISNPIHTIIHELALTEMIVPVSKNRVNIIKNVFMKIKKKEIFSYRRGMNPLALLAYLYKLVH